MFRRSRHREISTAAFLVGAAVVLFVVLGVHGASAADDEWIIEGGGWGHGVGLSQYGAYGMGLDGFSADEILAHYYSGATQAQAADSLGVDHWIFEDEALWIGLEQNAPTVEIEAVNGGLAVCQTGDGTGDCLVPDLVINPGETWRFEVIPESEPVLCRFVDSLAETESLEGSCAADVTWVDNADLEDPSVATLVRVNGEREYAHGSLRIRPNDPNPAIANSLHVSLSISLEDYLYGVAEVPSSWPDATLAAQTMIARSFGVAAATRRVPEGTLPAHRQRDCWCHLDATSVDQNFVGWSHESAGAEAVWGKRWVSAVDATTGSVVTHPSTGDTIISTYYSSSTGGATENNEDIWGGTPRAYLRSVDDHWAIEPAVRNPYDTWSVSVSRAAMRSALDEGWDSVVAARVLSGPPGTVVEFTGTLATDTVTTTRTGNWFRFKFSVRSPFVASVVAPDPDPPKPGTQFIDIEGSVHRESIAFIAEREITRGCNPPVNDRFCPQSGVTRGQMAAFLTRALRLPPTGEDFFDDDGHSVFQDDINRLAAAGITRGCNPPDNDHFCVDSRVTRGQMAAFLARAFGYTDPGAGDLFADDDGSTFEEDIDRLATAGITTGCNPPGNTRYCPDAVLTRAQMATFLRRALD